MKATQQPIVYNSQKTVSKVAYRSVRTMKCRNCINESYEIMFAFILQQPATLNRTRFLLNSVSFLLISKTFVIGRAFVDSTF